MTRLLVRDKELDEHDQAYHLLQRRDTFVVVIDDLQIGCWQGFEYGDPPRKSKGWSPIHIEDLSHFQANPPYPRNWYRDGCLWWVYTWHTESATFRWQLDRYLWWCRSLEYQQLITFKEIPL
jgi:hypothetical protein